MYDPVKQVNLLQSLGWRVHPCHAAPTGDKAAKAPRLSGWQQEATTHAAAVLAWAERYPGCAWGLAASDAVGVLDVDPKNGGHETLARLIAEHGPLPPTPKVKTGGGGEHYYLRFPAGTGCHDGFAPGLDIKAAGGNVILPPSKIALPEHEGRAYTWAVAPWVADIADAPAWLEALIRRPKAVSQPAVPRLPPHPQAAQAAVARSPWIVQGDDPLATHPGVTAKALGGEGRRPTLLKLVGSAIAAGLDADTILAQAEMWAGRCHPPLEDWRDHTEGLLRKEAGRAGGSQSHPPCPQRQEVKEVNVQPSGDGSTLTSLPLLTAPPPEAEPETVTSFTAPPEGEGSCAADRPQLHPDAYHGLLGHAAQAVAPLTEAEPAAVLMCMLTAFGNAAGLNPHWDHGKPHGANMFLGLVGPTSGKKGTASNIGQWLVGEADPVWRDTRVLRQGFGSGEGLIDAVRDARDDGNGKPDPGVSDKRLMVVEEEWAKAFALAGSDNSILSPVIRSAFDRSAIGKNNRGENAYGCRQPHISIVANITPAEFQKCLAGKHAGSLANGFVNRFLLCWTARARYLPRGGDWKAALRPLVKPVADALAHAREADRLALDDEAGRLWDRVYEQLETHPDDLFGMATARASDQVMKLALVYALTDKATAIRLPHLKAAMECWSYCEATARMLFAGGHVPAATPPGTCPKPDPLWLKVLNAIQAAPGVSRTDLTLKFKNTAKADAIAAALDTLKAKGLAFCRAEAGSRGPKVERWYPGAEAPLPDCPEGHHPSPPPASVWVVQPDAATEPPVSKGSEVRVGLSGEGEALASLPLLTGRAEAHPAVPEGGGGCQPNGQTAEVLALALHEAVSRAGGYLVKESADRLDVRDGTPKAWAMLAADPAGVKAVAGTFLTEGEFFDELDALAY
ncbi:MAG: bifunctional DNA primase/polymerase [Gemmataceae bacterium]